jgi:peptidoglycan hydrolase CwlO-like protein
MKKIIFLILLCFVLYIVSIFAFPSISTLIWEKLWLTWFNESVVKIKKDFNEFVLGFDVTGKYNDTKNQALEIKQNIETQVKETKGKIEVIQNNVDKTTQAVDNLWKTTNDLKNSVSDIIPGSWTGN